MKRVSKKQKRIRKGSKTSRGTTNSKKILRGKALHLLLGPEHFVDRLAAEKLRMFPNVARKIQPPFPRDTEVGFAGHYKNGRYEIQDREQFVSDYIDNVENAWYLRIDTRPGRKPRREDSGLVETNAAFSAGLAMVMAQLVRRGDLAVVRGITLRAAKSGMSVLCGRSGYAPAFLALHPDAEGTLSAHYGAWTVDTEKRILIGNSATGTRGKKGLRTIGDAFISILRHDRAIKLPSGLTWRPYKNLNERNPDDWAISEEMDRVAREEIGELPDGTELLKQADDYQREAAEDWLRRYRKSKAGVDKYYAELEIAKSRIAELEASLSKSAESMAQTRTVLELILSMPDVEKLLRSARELWKRIVQLARLVGLKLVDSEIDGSDSVMASEKLKTATVTAADGCDVDASTGREVGANEGTIVNARVKVAEVAGPTIEGGDSIETIIRASGHEDSVVVEPVDSDVVATNTASPLPASKEPVDALSDPKDPDNLVKKPAKRWKPRKPETDKNGPEM